ncbi:odorant receptor coreceptor-like isoform X4 [Lasioglossum baleicum]|uniref:odorant receptor coreceptor-like isoform X4 n=1 Tax=Lasioglossum baleicum TaxID=434251 RepID=UPI003FCD3D21
MDQICNPLVIFPGFPIRDLQREASASDRHTGGSVRGDFDATTLEFARFPVHVILLPIRLLPLRMHGQYSVPVHDQTTDRCHDPARESFDTVTSGLSIANRLNRVFRGAVSAREFPKRQNNGESNEQVLRRCIDRHVTLIKCRDTIQEIYGPIIFTIMMTNCLGMCALIFDVSKASAAIAVEKAVAITLYLTGKVLQTFTYTWPGDVVTNECDIFRQEVYCNNWYEDLNTKTGKLTLTILMQKPVILRACKLMTVTVDLFAKIMNRTISYYFLLVTLVDAE